MRTGRTFRLAAAAGIAIASGVASAAEPAAPGDPSRGRDLFIGSVPFRNGGAPCGACHAIGGERAAFAAALGPELSVTFAGMAPADMDPILEALPFPTMEPLYAARPLEPAERADLAAFLARAAGAPPPGAGEFLGWSAAVAAVLFAAVALASRRRRGSLREDLRARALPTHGSSR